ncbi:hypothetical protein EVAR_43141_1 [Eumeta japonica]|uniref:Uncharacterized protein n=1 Tax=Eumeta variegata TaxID=151549 RepID=A0A4C1XR20_EUMVA|nr:hypothetical protein EVAR_43141_1 [Eumeta japonica]
MDEHRRTRIRRSCIGFVKSASQCAPVPVRRKRRNQYVRCGILEGTVRGVPRERPHVRRPSAGPAGARSGRRPPLKLCVYGPSAAAPSYLLLPRNSVGPVLFSSETSLSESSLSTVASCHKITILKANSHLNCI